MGGIVGLVVGAGTALTAAWLGMPAVLGTSAAAKAFSCALVTGAFFGFVPAWRAARLEPAIALARQ
jgi:macrolide transport system ATP-binding/permease protein